MLNNKVQKFANSGGPTETELWAWGCIADGTWT